MTPDAGSRNLVFTGCPMYGPQRCLRWVVSLIASLVVVACLLGIVQPALACANGAARTDCCPAGSPAGGGDQMRPTSPSLEADSCCALPAAVTPSVSAVRDPYDPRPFAWIDRHGRLPADAGPRLPVNT